MNRYRTTLRPVPFGGIPQGVAWHYVEAPRDVCGLHVAGVQGIPVSQHLYGVIETDRPLTESEMRHFDIEEEVNQPPLGMVFMQDD
jgi:hypothetical protein